MPLCWYIATTSGDLLTILWVATIAEVLGYMVALWLLRDTLDLRNRAMVMPHGVAAAVVLGAVAWVLTVPTLTDVAPLLVWVAAGAGMALCLAVMPDLRAYIRTLKTP